MWSLALGDTGRRSETHAPDTETLTSPEKPVDGGVTVSQCLRASRAPIAFARVISVFSVTFHSVIFWGEACLPDAKSILPSWKVAQLMSACLNVSPTRAASHSYDESSLGRSRQLLGSDSLPWSCDPDARQCFRALMHDYTMQVVGRLRHAAQSCAVIWTSLPRCDQR
jgi:hypothetical protein